MAARGRRASLHNRAVVDGSARTDATAGDGALTDVAVGERVVILGALSRAAAERLDLCGLAGAEDVLVEHRGPYGDLIVARNGCRMHLPAHLACAVRVQRFGTAR